MYKLINLLDYLVSILLVNINPQLIKNIFFFFVKACFQHNEHLKSNSN